MFNKQHWDLVAMMIPTKSYVEVEAYGKQLDDIDPALVAWDVTPALHRTSEHNYQDEWLGRTTITTVSTNNTGEGNRDGWDGGCSVGGGGVRGKRKAGEMDDHPQDEEEVRSLIFSQSFIGRHFVKSFDGTAYQGGIISYDSPFVKVYMRRTVIPSTSP